MNVRTNSTSPTDAATEHPATKMHRLARELCAAMRENPDAPGMIMIHGDPALTHPIAYCENREHARTMAAFHQFRQAIRAFTDSNGVSARALRRAKDAAYLSLLDALIAEERV